MSYWNSRAQIGVTRSSRWILLEMCLLFTPQHLKIKTDFPIAHAYTVWLHAVFIKSGSFVEPGFVQHLAIMLNCSILLLAVICHLSWDTAWNCQLLQRLQASITSMFKVHMWLIHGQRKSTTTQINYRTNIRHVIKRPWLELRKSIYTDTISQRIVFCIRATDVRACVSMKNDQWAKIWWLLVSTSLFWKTL